MQNSATASVTNEFGTFTLNLELNTDGNVCEVSIYNQATGFGGRVSLDMPSNQFEITVKDKSKLQIDTNGNVLDCG
jgi:hypothetical protein